MITIPIKYAKYKPHAVQLLRVAVCTLLLANCKREPTVTMADHERAVTDFTIKLAEARFENNKLQDELAKANSSLVKATADVKVTSEKLQQLIDADTNAFKNGENLDKHGNLAEALSLYMKYTDIFPQGKYVDQVMLRIKAIKIELAEQETRRIASGQLSFAEWDALLANKTNEEIVKLLGNPTTTRRVIENSIARKALDLGIIATYAKASNGSALEIYFRENLPPTLLIPRTIKEWEKVLLGIHRSVILCILGNPAVVEGDPSIDGAFTYLGRSTDAQEMTIWISQGSCRKVLGGKDLKQ